MRLTLTLLKRKMPPGFIWTGKHRIAHHMYPRNINQFVKRMQIEENNLLLLRHPYLTLEQEVAGRDPNKHKTFVESKKLEKASTRMYRSKRLEEQYNHLLYGNTWDMN